MRIVCDQSCATTPFACHTDLIPEPGSGQRGAGIFLQPVATSARRASEPSTVVGAAQPVMQTLHHRAFDAQHLDCDEKWQEAAGGKTKGCGLGRNLVVAVGQIQRRAPSDQ